jgi:hypothetical protein
MCNALHRQKNATKSLDNAADESNSDVPWPDNH